MKLFIFHQTTDNIHKKRVLNNMCIEILSVYRFSWLFSHFCSFNLAKRWCSLIWWKYNKATWFEIKNWLPDEILYIVIDIQNNLDGNNFNINSDP